jgi:hypothetical protein
MLNFADNDLLEGIMSRFELADEITQLTILLLKQLNHDDLLAVHKRAEDLIAARWFETEFRDGDMEEVIEKFDPMLAGLVPWLNRNGNIHAINPGPPS